MARVKAIRQALVDTLKAAPALVAVKRWHKVDGIVPDRRNPTGSIGAGRTTYQQQDNEYDLATTTLPVYIATVDSDPERAEDQVQELGEDARLRLIADEHQLSSVVHTVDVEELGFTTAEADKLLIHFVTLQVTMTHLVPRIRPATEPQATSLVVQIQK